MAVNVFATASTAESLSRHDYIEWVNASLQCTILKIEDLCSGNSTSSRMTVSISVSLFLSLSLSRCFFCYVCMWGHSVLSPRHDNVLGGSLILVITSFH